MIGNSHLAEIFHLTLEARDRWDLGNLILTSQGTPLISGKVRDKISSSNSNGGNQQWWQMGRRCYTLPSEHSKSTSDLIAGKLDLAARWVGGELRSRPWQQELQGKDMSMSCTMKTGNLSFSHDRKWKGFRLKPSLTEEMSANNSAVQLMTDGSSAPREEGLGNELCSSGIWSAKRYADKFGCSYGAPITPLK